MQYAIRCTLYAIFSILHAVRFTLNAIFFHAIRYTLHATPGPARTKKPFYAKQTQFAPILRQKRGFCPKTNPIQTQFKPNQSQFKPKQTQFKPNLKPASRSDSTPIINTCPEQCRRDQQSIINNFPILAFWQDFLGKYLIDLPVFFLDRFADTVYHRFTFTDDEQDCGFKRILSTVLSFGRRYA